MCKQEVSWRENKKNYVLDVCNQAQHKKLVDHHGTVWNLSYNAARLNYKLCFLLQVDIMWQTLLTIFMQTK